VHQVAGSARHEVAAPAKAVAQVGVHILLDSPNRLGKLLVDLVSGFLAFRYFPADKVFDLNAVGVIKRQVYGTAAGVVLGSRRASGFARECLDAADTRRSIGGGLPKNSHQARIYARHLAFTALADGENSHTLALWGDVIGEKRCVSP
jgi:hypothetical protein